MALIQVASVNDLKDGENRVVTANGEQIALYKVNGKFYATTNVCPHRGGPLGEGFLEDKVVTCPWHGWKYDVITGANPNMPGVQIKTFNVVVQGDNVMIEV